MVLPDINKIAVLRANALGDYIFSLPALLALRAAYPHSEIVLLGQPWHARFLRGRPGPVDRVVVVPPIRGIREAPGAPGIEDSSAESEDFFQAVQAECFDLGVQLHGGGRNSNPFLLRLGARTTAGMRTPDAPALDRWIPYIYWQPEILRCLEVVSLVGANPVTLVPRLELTDADRRESLEIVPETSKPIVALHPGVSDGRRRWPADRFAAIGDALASAGAHVTVIGTDPERPIVDAVLYAMHADAQDLCGRLSQGGLAGLLARCRLLVGNDSGPLHVAEALGTPTVGIYWCGNLINAEPITRALHRPHLSWRLECSICGRNCIYDNCSHHESFVDKVTVEEVAASALELLATIPFG